MITAAVLFATALFSAGEFPSGPAVGDKLGEFKAHGVTGPDAGKEFKFLEKTKGAPTLLIFMHAQADNGITRPGLQFLRPVDKYAADNNKLATHIVWITGDKEKTEGFLKRAEQSLNLQSPVGICLEGKDGPAAYGINDKVSITVLVAKDGKVVANFALVDPNGKDATKVIAAAAKALGKEPPKEEKKEEKKERKAGAEKSPELQKLMRKMIQKDLSEEAAKEIAADMKKWAGNDEKKQTELREYARLVVRLGYGSEHGQAALKKLAE